MFNVKKMLTLYFVLTTVGFAQTSIGLRNPQNTKPLTSYRLPTWGYNALRLGGGFSLRDNTDEEERSSTLNKHEFRYIKLHLYPEFHRYYESEQILYNMYINSQGSFAYEEYKDEITGDREYERNQNVIETKEVFDFRVNFRYYIFSSVFLSLQSDGFFKYVNRDYKVKSKWVGFRIDESKRTSNHKDGDVFSILTFGIGKVRNITPIIRALRIQERLIALGKSEGLSEKEINNLAWAVTKKYGFYYTHQRYQKYFWENIHNAIDGSKAFSPFEVYYIQDALSEPIGYRQEGWSVEIGPGIDYVEKSRQYAGISSSIQCYKNISLNQQISFDLKGSAGKNLLNNDQDMYWGQLNIDYLHVLVDRILWQTSWDSKWTERVGDRYWNNPWSFNDNIKKLRYHRFNSSFGYFVEDNMSIGIDLYWVKDNRILDSIEYDKQSFGVNVGLIYYLGRVVF